MQIKYFQKGFNFSQDGPGNRLVYHLQGCNLKCPWCANPEGISVTGTIMTDGIIHADYCPKGAVSDNKIDRSKCAFCSMPCTDNPASGIKLSCTTADTEDVLKDILSCRMMFFDGGGVTFSGGEPTVQFDALRELLTRLKENSVNTAIECNGTNPRLQEIFGLVDHLIIDCKHHNSDIHKEVCGLGTKNIIKNISLASREAKDLLVRIPLIGSFNASEEDARAFAKLFKDNFGSNVKYEFLRYHEFGKVKYEKCGMKYTLDKEKCSVPPDTIKLFTAIFEENNLNTIHT